MAAAFSDKDKQRQALMEHIFREHHSEVHTYISHKVGQPEVANDLTSIVFLKAFRWLLEDRGTGQVRSWLYATARSSIADYWQEQMQCNQLPLEMLEGNPVAISGEGENRQVQQQITHLLSLLAPREREILRLRYFRGYTAAEIGQELGLRAGHVRVLQLRALRQAALLATQERTYSPMHINKLTYTRQGQQVLAKAKAEAQALQHHYIGTEHLLLGILAEGSAATPLLERGTTAEHVRAGLIFLVGHAQGNPEAGHPLTPQAQQVLLQAGQQARESGEAISPQHILHALQNAEEEYGISYGMLQALGVERGASTQAPGDEQANESALKLQEQLTQLYSTLDQEEERHLAHTAIRGEQEKKRAAYLKKQPDSQIVEEGKIAYFRLFMANQQLVLNIAKEYLTSGADAARLLERGNRGLSYAIHKFGMKKQVPFKAYATHWIHLEIMESVLQ